MDNRPNLVERNGAEGSCQSYVYPSDDYLSKVNDPDDDLTSFIGVEALPKGNRVYSAGQVAKICRVSPRTVSKWFDAGKFYVSEEVKGYRLPGCGDRCGDRRIPYEALAKFMREHGLPLGALAADECKPVILGVAIPRPIDGLLAPATPLEVGYAIGRGGFAAAVVGTAFGSETAERVGLLLQERRRKRKNTPAGVPIAVMLAEDTLRSRFKKETWDNIFEWDATDEQILDWCRRVTSRD